MAIIVDGKWQAVTSVPEGYTVIVGKTGEFNIHSGEPTGDEQKTEEKPKQ